MSRPCALYRFFDNADVLLYVGITVNLPARLRDHADRQWHMATRRIEVEWFESVTAAREAETQSIQREHPLHNVVASSMTWDAALAAGHLAELADRVAGRPPGERLDEAITAGFCDRPALIDLPSINFTRSLGYNRSAVSKAKTAARRRLDLPPPDHIVPARLRTHKPDDDRCRCWTCGHPKGRRSA